MYHVFSGIVLSIYLPIHPSIHPPQVATVEKLERDRYVDQIQSLSTQLATVTEKCHRAAMDQEMSRAENEAVRSQVSGSDRGHMLVGQRLVGQRSQVSRSQVSSSEAIG